MRSVGSRYSCPTASREAEAAAESRPPHTRTPPRRRRRCLERGGGSSREPTTSHTPSRWRRRCLERGGGSSRKPTARHARRRDGGGNASREAEAAIAESRPPATHAVETAAEMPRERRRQPPRADRLTHARCRNGGGDASREAELRGGDSKDGRGDRLVWRLCACSAHTPSNDDLTMTKVGTLGQ